MRKKKPYDCGALSPIHLCSGCSKGIKLNIIERKERIPEQCYRCYKIENPGHSKRDYNKWQRGVNHEMHTSI